MHTVIKQNERTVTIDVFNEHFTIDVDTYQLMMDKKIKLVLSFNRQDDVTGLRLDEVNGVHFSNSVLVIEGLSSSMNQLCGIRKNLHRTPNAIKHKEYLRDYSWKKPIPHIPGSLTQDTSISTNPATTNRETITNNNSTQQYEQELISEGMEALYNTLEYSKFIKLRVVLAENVYS